jgi:hypothetical protein
MIRASMVARARGCFSTQLFNPCRSLLPSAAERRHYRNKAADDDANEKRSAHAFYPIGKDSRTIKNALAADSIPKMIVSNLGTLGFCCGEKRPFACLKYAETGRFDLKFHGVKIKILQRENRNLTCG